MWKVLSVLFTGIIVSFYYFPFEFTFLPGLNTKMGLAVVGIILAISNLIKKKELYFPNNIVSITSLAAIVSLVGIISVIVNNTSDYAYATYFVSMFVWLSGAYTVCSLIKKVNNELTVENVTIYITCVCVVQCILALIIDSNLEFKSLVDTFIIQNQEFLSEVDRIYGIGASLDTAGVRFSACLLLLVYFINKRKTSMTNIQLFLSFLACLIIVILGNMMARTTIVGVGLSVLYFVLIFKPTRISYAFIRFFKVVMLSLIIVVPLSHFLYANNLQFHELIRFAFEGFFNLVETGEWQIDSGDKLITMIVFPNNLPTWLIGDGYFSNPYNLDPFYVGPLVEGYYMGTDIGYCRFIFYFGLIGLFAFSCFFIMVAKECIKVLPEYKMLILFILLLGFVIWMKVATDVFFAFALFLCIGNMQDDPQLLETES